MIRSLLSLLISGSLTACLSFPDHESAQTSKPRPSKSSKKSASPQHGEKEKKEKPSRPVATEKSSTSRCYKADSWTCQVEAEIVAETNRLRKGRSLRQDYESSFVARRWSQEQAQSGRISHKGFPKQRKASLQSEFPERKTAYRAENVAMTSIKDEDPERVAQKLVQQWWKSEGHRKNMVGPYESIAVGVSRKNSRVYATQIFY